MTDGRKIHLIRPDLDRRGVEEAILAHDNAAEIRVGERVLYPYFAFEAMCSVPGLIARKDILIHCVIDGRKGIGATTVVYETDEETAGAGILLGCELSMDEARKSALRYLTHAISRRTKTISSFDVALTQGGLVYKAFWLARAGQHEFIVDSTTGQMHSIRRAA